MSEQKIDMGKTYRTRDGRAVRVLCVDAKRATQPVVALITRDNVDAVSWFNPNGRYYTDNSESPLDLIEVKPRIKRKVWLNVYPTCVGEFAFKTKANADAEAGKLRIACVEVDIDVEEGHGL